MTMVTTIQLHEKIKHKLEGLKIHPRETYNEVIERLIRRGVEEEELSPHAMRNIEAALEDVKKGRLYSTNEVKKKLGIR